MKVVWIALAVLVVLCIFIGIHSYIMSSMAEDILTECRAIYDAMYIEDWNTIMPLLDKIKKMWESHRTWATLTIKTDDIEQIEISLAQSRAFAESKQISGFVGEFVMFTKLVGHIPTHEGIHWEEIL